MFCVLILLLFLFELVSFKFFLLSTFKEVLECIFISSSLLLTLLLTLTSELSLDLSEIKTIFSLFELILFS